MFAHRAGPCSLACLVLSLAPFAHGEPPASPTSGKPHTDRHGDFLPPGAIARLGSVRFRTGNDFIALLRFSPNGQTLYSIAQSGYSRVWSADTGGEKARFRLPDFRSWDLTDDGRLLASRIGQHTIRIVGTASGKTIRIMATANGKTVRELTVPNHDLHFVTLAPDGKAVAALATHEKTEQAFLRIWRLPDGQALRDIPIETRKGEKTFSVEALGFTADGKSLIARLDEKESLTLRRWDIATGRELPTTPHPYPEDQKPTLSPDGKLLALGFQDDRKEVRVRLVDAANGQTRRELDPAMTGRLFGMRFSADGRTLLAAVEAKQGGDVIQLWDVAKGKPLPPPALDTIFVRDAVFSPDGRTFAVLEEDAVHLCETTSGKRLHRMNISYPFDDMRQSGYTPPKRLPACSAVAFSPDSKRLAVAPPYARLIRLWDVPTGKEIRPVSEGHEREVEAIAFAPDGKTVASVSSDGTVRLWEASTGRQLHVLPLAVTGPEHILISDCASPCIAFSPDSRTIATVSKLNVVQFWAVDTGASRLQFVVPNGGIGDLLFSPDGKRLLTGSHGRILSWNAATGKAIHSPGTSMPADAKQTDEEDAVLKLAPSPDGRLLAAMGERTITHEGNRVQVHELRLWEWATGKLRWRIPNDDDARRILHRYQLSRYTRLMVRGTRLAAFAPDGKTLVWNDGEAITLIDVARGAPLRQFGSRLDAMSEIAFSPRDNLLAIAHSDGRVRFVDPASGTLRGVLDVPAGGLGCIAFSPDGRTLATGGSDTTILLWDVNSIRKAWRTRSGSLHAEEMDKLWERLSSANGIEAAETMARLEDVPQQTVALLRQRLCPALPLEPDRVSRLLDDLASDDFSVRQRAAKELEKLGELAEPFLRKQLAQHPPLEVRRRLEALAETLEGIPLRADHMRADRAVEVLEHLGTAEAVALLRELAGGAPAARRTRESKTALARLARRTAAP